MRRAITENEFREIALDVMLEVLDIVVDETTDPISDMKYMLLFSTIAGEIEKRIFK